MDQTQELDVVLLPYDTHKSKSGIVQEDDDKRNVRNASIKTIKTKPRRSCKPFFKFFLRVGVMTAICAIGYWTVDVSKTMMRSFWERPDSFTVDTLNLHWNTTFPGITVCQVFNGERNWELSEKYYGEDRDKRLDDFIIDITYFSGTCYSCELCQQDLQCPEDFGELLSKFRSICDNMITNCTWNDVEFDCCKMFLPLETEFGTCYTINSINTKPPASRILVSTRKTGPGRLTFALLEDVQIFIHPPNEVPHAFQDRELKQTVLWGSKKEIILKTEDIIDPEKSSASCFKPKGFTLYEAYTASTCAIACHIQAQIYYCNCTHHFMPHRKDSKVPICTYEGLMCLTQHFADISKHRKECKCAPSCESIMLTTVQELEEEQASEYGSLIKISQMQLSTLRYIKRSTKSNLSFVISFGGLIGLIYGISFLSMVEYVELIFTFVTKQFKRFISFIFTRKNGTNIEGNGRTKTKKNQKNKKIS